MIHWIDAIRARTGSDVWGFVVLDYYFREVAGKTPPNDFLHRLLPRLWEDAQEPLSFHKVQLSVALQLLGNEFDEIVDLTRMYYRSLGDAANVALAEEFAKDYTPFGKEQVVLERLLPGGAQPHVRQDVADRSVKRSTGSGSSTGRVGVLAFASEWFSAHGGVSTLNRELCRAIAALGFPVVCSVVSADENERGAALEAGVTLVSSRKVEGFDADAGQLLPPGYPEGFEPAMVIGHGHITGEIAKLHAETLGLSRRRVHIVHTAPSELEFYKERDEPAHVRAEAKAQRELRCASSAAMVFGVGPRLKREIGTALRGLSTGAPPVRELSPGLALRARIEPPDPSDVDLVCLWLGRAEDRYLKGIDIAVDAVCSVVERGRVRGRVYLDIRGLDRSEGDVWKELQGRCGRGNIVRVQPYTAKAETVEEALRRAAVVLMPSRAEGFGLVAWEAMALGVPVLVSDQSGVAEIVRERCPELVSSVVVPVNGTAADRDAWISQLEHVLLDVPAAFGRIRQVSEKLAREYSWERAARIVMSLLGDSVL